MISAARAEVWFRESGIALRLEGDSREFDLDGIPEHDAKAKADFAGHFMSHAAEAIQLLGKSRDQQKGVLGFHAAGKT
jgi:hypothetical protein